VFGYVRIVFTVSGVVLSEQQVVSQVCAHFFPEQGRRATSVIEVAKFAARADARSGCSRLMHLRPYPREVSTGWAP
jgi:hypothetical protein